MSLLTFNQAIKQIILSVRLAFALLFVLLSFNLLAEANRDVLVVNSNYTINKYALVQDAFVSSQEKTVITINLPDSSVEQISNVIKNNNFKIIYCIGTKAYQTIHHLHLDQEIIFSSVINWRRLPNVIGSYGISQELSVAMQLMMYRYLFPNIKKIGVLYSKQFNAEWMIKTIKDAKEFGIEIIGQDISSTNKLSEAIEILAPKIDVLWLISDPLVLAGRSAVETIFQQSQRHKIPVFSYSKVFIDFGAILAISADAPTIGRQVSARVDEVINNKKDIDRVSHPAGSYVVLNMKHLKQYSLELNKEALASVNQIVE